MPRYFIDYQDGETHFSDEEGSDLRNLDDAREQAISVFPRLENKPLPVCGRHSYMSSIRNEYGELVYRATLTFSDEYLTSRPD